MRTREEIEEANKAIYNLGQGILVEDKATKPGETLILEVLLDIRDLLDKK